MAQITAIPELRTPSGEVVQLEISGKYAGTLMLVYREGESLLGGVQLDKTALSENELEELSTWTEDYVHALADALAAQECEVFVTSGEIDHIISSVDYEVTDEPNEDSMEPIDDDTLFMESSPVHFALMLVGERDDRVEYHIYGPQEEWKAEAFFVVDENELIGDVNWIVHPTEEEIDAATELLLSEVDEDDIDMIVINMRYQGELLETIELTHEDLSDSTADNNERDKDYTVLLVRDDADALTYDIYEQSSGGLPIARAIIDISRRRITGMIEFREPTGTDDRENMAAALLRELDKEKDYDSVNITMMHHNRRIEDILFENEKVH